MPSVTIIGGGLAGCEAAWQLAQAGISVRLVEMKPHRRTEAQVTDQLAELVCSNSLRSKNPLNAVGLIKDEMRRLDSLIIACATAAAVPAGDALAVERQLFAEQVLSKLHGHPNLEVVHEIVTALPAPNAEPTIVATGPLTSRELAEDIKRVTGHERLAFYDAIAPIVSADSVDRTIAFAASRYGKGSGDDYLNCPFTKDEYLAFHAALLTAECMPLHDFESAKYFEGCLPIEVIASRGEDAPRYGCMKPVGLSDPRTEGRPYAVVQLRQEDRDGQAFNLVGFQTKMKYPEQRRVFRMIPGLADVEFLRLGAVHRNTFLDSPALLDERMHLTTQDNLLFAGQITGVEGYVESAAHGLMTARLLAADLSGSHLVPPPRDTALGALWGHVRGAHRLPGRPHEPQNVNWSMFPPPAPGVHKRERKRARVIRGVDAFEAWAQQYNVAIAPRAFEPEAIEVPEKKKRRRRPKTERPQA